jgi:hypothetical protein
MAQWKTTKEQFLHQNVSVSALSVSSTSEILQMITEILVSVHISLGNTVIKYRVREWHVTQAHFLLGKIIKLGELSVVFLLHRLPKLAH